MKRLFYLYLLALPFLFTGCDKEEDELGGLAGTTWENVKMNGSTVYETGRWVFKNATEFVYFFKDTKSDYSLAGTYIYTEPNIALTAKNIIGKDYITYYGTITGNKLNVTYEGEDGEEATIIVYTRK
jgi:hypothetical protein